MSPDQRQIQDGRHIGKQGRSPYPDPFNPEKEELGLKQTTAPNLEEIEADVRAQVDRIFHYLKSEGRTLSFHSV